MAKTLELLFVTDTGKSGRLSIDNPKEPIDPVLVKQAMEAIITSQAFFTGNGFLTSVSGARVVDRNVTDYEL
ncbi:DUF2922 domain-containing protein [Bacillus sp. T3]|uniref:DUF2922 domain-containing protein n=1 Tax=Bacillus sp. T3 TaxID=467262 RepID=UPI002981F982|nr:DUF2922 domain-containing protein [Bacillus sp. T3]